MEVGAAALRDPAAFRRFLQRMPLEHLSGGAMPDVLRLLRRGSASASAWSDAGRAYAGVELDALPLFLDAILLSHADIDEDDQQSMSCAAFFERFKPRSSNQVLCGYLFQRNDIVFNCKTCQADETCVLCLKCFQNGNHEGHDVFFHRTSPGGVCDCGDSEAWAPEGFCIYHGRRHNDAESDAGGEASENAIPLPQEIVRVADALFEAIVTFCVEMARRSMHVFDPERVDEQGRQMLNALRTQNTAAVLGGVAMDLLERQFHVRICNDDVHSDEDLIRSLSLKHIPKAEDLVRAIDSNGSEIVAANLTLRDALTLMQELKAEGWHVCVVQDQHIHDENVLLGVTRWVKSICSLSKPLHELFCDKLFSTTNSAASPKEPIQIMFLSDPYFRKDIVLELYELYLKLQGDKDPKLKFSIVFMKVYNRMMLKYFCGVGTREESLFQYGVQILTTPSIVNHLAGMGLLENLLDTINTALDLAKQTINPSKHLGSRSPVSASNVWRTLDCDHALLKFRRYHFVLENLGYVLGIASMCSELLMREDLLRKWFEALNLIQGLDPQTRIQEGRAHVTYETQSWMTAFSFHSNVSKVLALMARGLQYHEGDDSDKQVMVFNVLGCFWQQLELFGIPESRFQLYTPPFGCLAGLSRSDKIVKFSIDSQPVSFHNTLHNALATFLMETLHYGPSLPSGDGRAAWISDWTRLIDDSIARHYRGGMDDVAPSVDPRKRDLLIYGLMEYPLRTLVLCAQVHSGLWIRNGQNMQRQVINYVTPPWCSELRDLDLFLVQVSAALVGFPKFVTIFFDRFGLSEFLLTWLYSRSDASASSRDTTVSGAIPDEKLVGLLEMALVHLIWIVTELTPPLSAIDEEDTVLRREIIHRLSQQPCRLSELLDQTTFVVSTPFGGVSARPKKQHLTRVERILEEVADEQVSRPSSVMAPLMGDGDYDANGDVGGEPTKYELKKEFYREYDPAFNHLSRSSHEKAQFARQEALFKTWKVEDTPIPLVSMMPPAHVSLQPVRTLILERSLLGVLRLILEDAAVDNAGVAKRTNVMVILRAIHLINLVVLVLQAGREHSSAGSTMCSPVPESKRRQTLVLLRSGPEAFEEGESARGNKRVKRQQNADSDTDFQMSSE